MALVWAKYEPSKHAYGFSTTCIFNLEQAQETIVTATLDALWKWESGKGVAYEQVTLSGGIAGTIDAVWSCPGAGADPFVSAAACTRTGVGTVMFDVQGLRAGRYRLTVGPEPGAGSARIEIGVVGSTSLRSGPQAPVPGR